MTKYIADISSVHEVSEKEKKLITLEQIKNIVIDIKSDDEWVNDSQTQAEYKGVCDGLDMLVNHLEELEKESDD